MLFLDDAFNYKNLHGPIFFSTTEIYIYKAWYPGGWIVGIYTLLEISKARLSVKVL